MPAERIGPRKVAGVLLAAGSSTRMGGANKLLLELDGESVLRRAARRAAAAGLDPVVVVLGHEAERAQAELARGKLLDVAVRTVVNPDYALGVNGSLKTGIAAVPADVRAAVVLLADMPFVTEEMIGELVARYRASDAPLVVSEYGGVSAPPILYDRSLFAELGAMAGEGCGKQVVRKHRAEAIVVEWPAAALTDLDRPEDWERIRAGAAGGDEPCAVIS